MAEFAHSRRKKVDVKSIFAKRGREWGPGDKAGVALWLTMERWSQYVTIGRLCLRAPQDAEDAFQGFIQEIIEIGLPNFDPGGNADSFVLGAWRNYLTDYRRRWGRRVRREKEMPCDEDGKPIAEAVDRDMPIPTIVDLKQRLEFLSRDQRQVILLRIGIEDDRPTPFKDVAKKMGKSEDAVKKDYQRGMRSLRKQADKEDQKTASTVHVPPGEEHQRTGQDADAVTDERLRHAKSEDSP